MEPGQASSSPMAKLNAELASNSILTSNINSKFYRSVSEHDVVTALNNGVNRLNLGAGLHNLKPKLE